MAEGVYLLCALTSVGCSVLLFRGYCRTRTTLLLWTSIGFLGWTVNNILLFADLVVFPDIDLGVWRPLSALVGMGFFLYGLIKHSVREGIS